MKLLFALLLSTISTSAWAPFDAISENEYVIVGLTTMDQKPPNFSSEVVHK